MPNLDTSAAESQKAPVTEPVRPAEPATTGKRIERQGVRGAPAVHHYPQVRGGTCEFCGTIDPNYAAEQQYKLCEHFRGQDLRCSYCDEAKNPNDVIGHAVLNIYDHPTQPNTLVVVCDSYECTRKHQQRFETAG